MDRKVALLEAFFSGMCKDRAKVETKQYGFSVLEEFAGEGCSVDYVQMENHGVHKYRLFQVSAAFRKLLLEQHIAQKYNLCLYFDKLANQVLCFNLDHNYKRESTEDVPDMARVVDCLQKQLAVFGMEGLCVKSGRGYHVWCRFDKAIANERLLEFMIRISARTLAMLHYQQYDYRSVKINMSPNPKFVELLSLRAFGSKHMRTGDFSQILAKQTLLDEGASWRFFEEYMQHKTIPEEVFTKAYAILLKAIVC